MPDFIVVVDELRRPLGGQRPGVALAGELALRGFSVLVKAPCSDATTAARLRGLGVRVEAGLCGDGWHPPPFTFVEAVIRQWRLVMGRGVRGVNFSNQYPIPASVYYFQGFMTSLAKAVAARGPSGLRAPSAIGLPVFASLDLGWLVAMRRSGRVVANSAEAVRQLLAWGIRAPIVPPPIPRDEWVAYREAGGGGGAAGSRWGEGFAAVHLGKETVVEWLIPVLRLLRSRRVPILFFGGKAVRGLQWLRAYGGHVGFLEEGEMPLFYASALLTVFTYSHEPFGYIPLESVAAGTPALIIGPPSGAACSSVIRGVHYAAPNPRAAAEAVDAILDSEEEVDSRAALNALDPTPFPDALLAGVDHA